MKFKFYKHCLLAFAFVSMAVQVCFAQIEFTEHTIAGNFDGAVSVYAADIDSDGDMDVLGAACIADDITWWENDGEQDFTEHTIAGDFDGAISVYVADIDSDGDMDVLGAANYAHDITWWKNDGEQDFTEHTIAGDFNSAISVYVADIDSDGDMDVLGAAANADDITWWESNLDPEHIWEPPHSDLPEEFIMYNAYPNPFNPTTQVRFGLPKQSILQITVLDTYGRTVATLADRAYKAGFHSVTWDAAGFPTGIYFVRLEAGGVNRIVKMTLIR